MKNSRQYGTKRSKYHNQKVYVDGIRFDSKKEARRYIQLKELESAGEIHGLELQPEYEILPSYKKNGKTIRRTVYRADFRYFQGDKVVVEDVKGVETDIFRLKRKLVEYFYPDVTITLL